MRTRRKVINSIIKTLRKFNYTGIAIEPIPIAADPDNEIEGDYMMRVSFEVALEKDKFFLKSFEAPFPMRYLQKMSAEQFDTNMKVIRAMIKKFADDDSLDNARGVSTTTGTLSLGEYLTKINREVKQ